MSQQIKNFIYPAVFALLLSAGFIFVYQMFFVKNMAQNTAISQSAETSNKIINPNFDLKVFEDERFKKLEYFGN